MLEIERNRKFGNTHNVTDHNSNCLKISKQLKTLNNLKTNKKFNKKIKIFKNVKISENFKKVIFPQN